MCGGWITLFIVMFAFWLTAQREREEDIDGEKEREQDGGRREREMVKTAVIMTTSYMSLDFILTLVHEESDFTFVN